MSENSGEKIRPEDEDWDARYRADGQVWSGHVNGSMAEEVEGLTPARALDIGCGEGADAIWLAERGWQVTAVDISPTAIERGRTEATIRGLDVDFQTVDLLASPPERDAFDLVVLMYPAFPMSRRADAVVSIAGAVAPGGLLLMVGHAPPTDLENAPYDPADWLQPDDIAHDLLQTTSATETHANWITEKHETKVRPGDHHHGSVHSHDIVIGLRRPSTE